MTPVALLVAFCALMAAIALGRLAIDDGWDRVEIGSALVVVGITVLSGVWVAVVESVLARTGQVLLGIVGTAVVCVGIVLIVHYWGEPPESTASCD
ncbi:hypothetical protein GS429_16720 [Natronorubrum sp. JWXQ-INN-674]|uniref:Uncharacterized protein n=1 Tax=Natronorubrum halalkaliphilum TaxID=2691917 RepID=A0A6B0VSB5_9EURY|nr:hypothetical protein [Natronorubrum halalkaliphilum]MXV63672.1 hypothetical protein [Natronorubrum halalkaliphilum]